MVTKTLQNCNKSLLLLANLRPFPYCTASKKSNLVKTYETMVSNRKCLEVSFLDVTGVYFKYPHSTCRDGLHTGKGSGRSGALDRVLGMSSLTRCVLRANL